MLYKKNYKNNIKFDEKSSISWNQKIIKYHETQVVQQT